MDFVDVVTVLFALAVAVDQKLEVFVLVAELTVLEIFVVVLEDEVDTLVLVEILVALVVFIALDHRVEAFELVVVTTFVEGLLDVPLYGVVVLTGFVFVVVILDVLAPSTTGAPQSLAQK